MAKRLFVGGLPYTITDAQLQDMFAPFGAIVSCSVITDRMTGRSKGFGFVEMEDDKAAEEAIAKLNGTELEGRKIAVNEARPRPERSEGSYQPRRDFNDRRGSYRSDNRRGGRY